MTEKEKTGLHKHERSAEAEQLKEAADKQHEIIREQLEQAERTHHEKASQQEILTKAKELAEEHEKPEETVHPSPAERRRGAPSKKQLSTAFDETMKEVRNEMGPGSRLLSRFIHSRPVEAVSSIASSTIARPNALLSGSITAFVVVTALYFAAKHYGFQLSGFETIAAFAIGWIIGILYDYFSLMIKGRKN